MSKKITALTAITSVDPADVLPIVDLSSPATTKKVTVQQIVDLADGGTPGGGIFGADLAHFWGGRYDDSTGTWIDEAGDEDADNVAAGIPTEDTINGHTFPTFDGVNDSLSAGVVDTLDGLSSYCIFACFNAGDDAFGSVLEQALQFGIQFVSQTVLVFVNSGSGSNYMQGTSTIDDNRWHRVILNVDAGAASLYVDGVLEDTSTFSAISTSALNTLRFGVSGSGVFYEGGITACGIATRAATVEEVLLLDAGLANWVGGSDATSFRGVPLGNDTPAIGGVWVYDGTTYVAKKPTPPNWFDVTDYGAVADGVTDDSAAVAAAISAAGATKGTVYFPSGTYRLASKVTWNRGVTLRGSGPARYGDFTHASKLLVDDGVTGIHALHSGMAGADGGTASGACIQDLYVKAAGHAGATAYGLHMQTNIHVLRCTFENFSSHGIFVDSISAGFPDNWHVQWTRCTANGGDGFRTEGQDSNNGLAIGLDVQANKGWGIYEASFLGNTYLAPHTAENLMGGVYTLYPGPGASNFLGLYGEADQPPNEFAANNVTLLGGFYENGVTSASRYFGGYAHAAHATTFVSTSNIALTATGTNPPRVSLKGSNTSTTSASVRIEITTTGYPDGKDKWGVAAGATARYRWSINGGSSWTGPLDMPAAWDPYNLSLADVTLGSTGLTAVFTPGLYTDDNVWTGTADGAPQSFFRGGSEDGSLTTFAWGHVDTGATGADFGGFDLKWSASLEKWQFRWGGSGSFQHAEFTGGALPLPGKLTFNDSLYFGTEEHGYSRIGAADGGEVVGSADWLNSSGLAYGQVAWWPAGSLILNKSDSVRRPGAWRATRNGGWGYAAGTTSDTFDTATVYRPGESVAANGYVYRALNRGLSASVDNTGAWSTTPGTTFSDGDGTITWEVYGPEGTTLEPLFIQSEVLGSYDATAGNATLTLEECSYERLKITGTPVGAFSLVMPDVDDASGWVRVVWNTSGQTCTVKGSVGDAGIAVPNAKAYQILSDGTNCVRVE